MRAEGLDAHGLDSPAHAAVLEARLLGLNPYEYSDEYKAYQERTLRFLRTALTDNADSSAAHSPSPNAGWRPGGGG